MEPPRPTQRAAIPFVILAGLGAASVFLPPFTNGWRLETVAMVVTFFVALDFLVVSIRRSHHSWIDPIPPYLYFIVLALGRDLTGGTESGLGPLVILPLLWLALTGTYRELLVASGLAGLVFFAPLVAIGEPLYDFSDVRKGFVWMMFGAFVAPTVLQLVRRLTTETLKERAVRAELDGLLRGARLSGIIATDLQGTITAFGPGAEELLGFRADDVIGRRRPTAFHDPQELAEAAEELGVERGFGVLVELARREEPARVWTYIRADGRRIFVRLVQTELRDLDGVVTGYMGVAIDATAAVEAERAQVAAEARLRLLLQNLPDTVLTVVDEDERIQFIGGQGAAVPSQDAIGSQLAEASSPENMEVWRPLLRDAFNGVKGTADLTSAASGRDFEVVVSPLPEDETGRRALIIGRDVTERRERDRAVVRARDRAERLFADAPHGVAVLSTSGEVLRANAAMLSLMRDPDGGLLRQPLGDLSAPGDRRFARHLADVLDNGSAGATSEWTMRVSDDDDVHVVLTSRLLQTADGSTDQPVVLTNVVDVSERHRYEQRLAHLADHDVLTGLANRRLFNKELSRHLEHCERYGPTGAVLLMDLDNFKEVNDTLGHPAGDELIVSTAALLKRSLRRGDVVARLGGDEFAILLPAADREAAVATAENLVQKIRDHTASLDGTRRRVTASIGVVPFHASIGESAEVLSLADMSMYDAKDAGRDGVSVLSIDATKPTRSGARLQWRGRIESALESDEFVLHLQPILSLATGRIKSAEALVRLDDTDELVSPGRFLYIAERTGLAPSLDAWVLRQSIATLAKLREVDPSFELAVNLSGHSIGHPSTERVVTESLSEFGVDPSALILEVTETSAVADVGVAREFAERMSALGCTFALDDFGAGFGSFYYLKHLLFDYVKIDGEFVANCHRSATDRKILRSIVGVAHDLGKRTVAEFVAEQAILDVVREEGVDFAQGYLIGEPEPFNQFVQTMTAEPKWSA